MNFAVTFLQRTEFVPGFSRANFCSVEKSKPSRVRPTRRNLTLLLAGAAKDGQYELTLTAINKSGKELGSVSGTFPAEAIQGNVCIANNIAAATPNRRGGGKFDGARYAFRDWHASGKAFTVTPENKFGPILWSMYTLSDSRSDEGFVMKMNALTGPMGPKDSNEVQLFKKQNDDWKLIDTAQLDPDAWTATFRIANWNEKVDTPYMLVYHTKHPTGSQTASVWTGTVKANPSGRPLRLGALTCQNDYAFPYAPVADNLVNLDPDMLYFSGDQLYEGHGGFGIIRDPAEPAILNYLRKFYQFGWSFREAMKDRPTVCIPDDHDVFQGNIWGEAGKAMDVAANGASSNGGYREPARMVNVVHKPIVVTIPTFTIRHQSCKASASTTVTWFTAT